MTRPICDTTLETAVNCLSLIERGMRRLGINPNAEMTRLAQRTRRDVRSTAHERAVTAAISTRGAYELSDHQIARILQLHHGGKTQAQIAAAIGCSQGTVAKRLHRLGFRKSRKAIAA